MSAKTRIRARLCFTFALAAAFVIAVCLASRAQQPEPPKKPADGKTVPSGLPVIKLPDGTYILTGTPTDGSESVTIPLKELQKLQDLLDQLQKQVTAAQKVSEPSVCSIRGRVDKRGEQLVAVLKLTYWFRTTLPQTMISLGGRKGFLVSASVDGARLPILKNIDDGFAALIESAGEHSLTIDLDAPITARGANAKTELGFEIGLPHAPDHHIHTGTAKSGCETCHSRNTHVGYDSTIRSTLARYQIASQQSRPGKGLRPWGCRISRSHMGTAGGSGPARRSSSIRQPGHLDTLY